MNQIEVHDDIFCNEDRKKKEVSKPKENNEIELDIHKSKDFLVNKDGVRYRHRIAENYSDDDSFYDSDPEETKQ